MPSIIGKRYPHDYTDEELRAQAHEIENAITIPVNIQIKADHRVLDFGEVEKILKLAKKLVLQNCGCRTDKGNCDAPNDVCITIDPPEDYVAKFSRYNARESTLEEALDALKRSHEAGLVHLAYTMKGDDEASIVCSCCPCCCHTLGGLLRHGISTQVLTSKFIAEQSQEKCVACGKCVQRCVFGARDLDNGELKYDQSKCFGCGLCVSTCPVDAVSLTRRS
jgi:Pyruvate/2-oxoacid:ferredoxin oxidoreductase delta subunit